MPPRANRSLATGSAPRTHSLARRLQQQKAALAEFGVEAFGAQDLDWLLYKASELAGQGLGVQRAKVLELLPGEDKFLIRAGVGWDPDVVGNTTIDASTASPAGYALRSVRPSLRRTCWPTGGSPAPRCFATMASRVRST